MNVEARGESGNRSVKGSGCGRYCCLGERFYTFKQVRGALGWWVILMWKTMHASMSALG
jgi:hypothetical protein